MDKERDKTKKQNQVLLISCVILGVLVVMLGGYFIYNKFVKTDSSEADNVNKQDPPTKTDEYQTYSLDGINVIEEKFGKLLFYIPNSMTDFNNLTDKAKMEFIWPSLKQQRDETPDENGNMQSIFKKEKVNQLLIEYFGDDIQFDYDNWNNENKQEGINPIADVLYALKYDSMREYFVLGTAGATGDPTDPEVVWKWVSAKANNDEVIYTAQVIFRNRDLSISKDVDGTDKIGKMILDEEQGKVYHSEGKKLEDFLNQSYTYEYTFSKDSSPILKSLKIIK